LEAKRKAEGKEQQIADFEFGIAKFEFKSKKTEVNFGLRISN
jgi:predicted DNA binding CopG/RHH family protein